MAQRKQTKRKARPSARRARGGALARPGVISELPPGVTEIIIQTGNGQTIKVDLPFEGPRK